VVKSFLKLKALLLHVSRFCSISFFQPLLKATSHGVNSVGSIEILNSCQSFLKFANSFARLNDKGGMAITLAYQPLN